MVTTVSLNESARKEFAGLPYTEQELKVLEWLASRNPNLANAYRRMVQGALSGEKEEEEGADPWQTFTVKDAYTEREPVKYLVEGLFQIPSLNIVYGSPGTLKSFLLQDLMTCVVKGEAWLAPCPEQAGNGKGRQTEQAAAMWIDFDNGQLRTHDRFSALGRMHDLGTDAPLIYYSMPAPRLNGADEASMAALASRIKAQGVKLVVIDNLGLIIGEVEENSNEMAKVMGRFRQLVEDTGAATILIHHQRKGNPLMGRAGDSLRGHSSIEAAIDLALRVDREMGSDEVKVLATKARGEQVTPFGARFTYHNDDQGRLAGVRFWGIRWEDIASREMKDDMAKVDEAIQEELRNGPLNKKNLAENVRKKTDIGINRIKNWIGELVESGKIIETQGIQTNEKLYCLPENRRTSDDSLNSRTTYDGDGREND